MEGNLTWRVVVADGEERWNIRANIAKTLAGAVDGSAANISAADPDDLGIVAIAVKRRFVIDVVGGGLAVQAVEVPDLGVVEEVGDDRGDVVRGRTGRNVLAVAAASGINVVGIIAAVGDLESDRSEGSVPLHGRGRVVLAVNVVVGHDVLGVSVAVGGIIAASGSSRCSRRGSSRRRRGRRGRGRR